MTAMLVYITIRNIQIIQTYADSGSLHILVFGKSLYADDNHSSQKGKRETCAVLWQKNAQVSKGENYPPRKLQYLTDQNNNFLNL